MKKIFIFSIPFLLLIFLFGSRFLIVEKSFIFGSFLNLFKGLSGKIFSFSEYEVGGVNLSQIVLENESLKAKYGIESSRPYVFDFKGEKLIKSKVYSSYPFSNKALLEINSGSKNGVVKGDAVLFNATYFIGEISEVYDDFSVVKTIFDPSWKMSVKIGSQLADSLFVGGRNPKLTLISKKNNIIEGDDVISASKFYSYGLTIGKVKNITNASGSGFLESEITFPYDLAIVAEVEVVSK